MGGGRFVYTSFVVTPLVALYFLRLCLFLGVSFDVGVVGVISRVVAPLHGNVLGCVREEVFMHDAVP